MYKCDFCHITIEDEYVLDGKCPECQNNVMKMCKNDVGSCNHGVVDGTVTCEICGEFICPTCGSHDCTAISRITGYMSPVGKGAWNSAKVQELSDRHRYEL